MKELYLNKGISSLVRQAKEERGINLTEIAREAEISQNHFSRLINPKGAEPRAMTEKQAYKILLALDYKPSEAKKKISEIKMRASLAGLNDEDKKEVMSIVAGDYSIVITGGNNTISK